MKYKVGDRVMLNPEIKRTGDWTYKGGVVYTVNEISGQFFDTKEQRDKFVKERFWIFAKEENEI